jgi:hypothetical protein
MPDNNTVEIDTSGPGAEIELENDSKETETPELETAQQEETKTEVVEEQPQEETKVEAKEDTKESSKEDELAQYSESVQKRIAKLTKKWREAERQKDEALNYAKSVITDKEKAEQKLSKIEPSFLKTTEDGIKSGLEAAKAQLAKAREAGDINAEVEAQSLISEYAYKQVKFNEAKAEQELYAKQKETEIKQPQVNLQRENVAQGTPDPKAEQWASKNSWFGQDTAMTYTAFDLHKKLTEQEGFDPSSDEYYSEIDKRIRLEFPHKFVNNEQKAETAKPVQTVASAKRSTKTGRRTVRLTPSQVAIAKKLGVPLEEYAKQLNITKEV